MGGPSTRKCILCRNSSNKKKSVSLYSFPGKDNEAVYWKWLEICGLTEDTSLTAKRVCSKHFKPEDFICRNEGGRLHRSAVPSLKLPKPKGTSYLCGISTSLDYSANISNYERINISNYEISGQSAGQLTTTDEEVIFMDSSSPPPVLQADEFDSSLSMSFDNSPTSAGAGETPQSYDEIVARRPVLPFNNVSEIQLSDFATPLRGSRCLNFIKSVDMKKDKQIKRLLDRNRKLTTQVANLKRALKLIRKQEYENRSINPEVNEEGEKKGINEPLLHSRRPEEQFDGVKSEKESTFRRPGEQFDGVKSEKESTSQGYTIDALERDLMPLKVNRLPADWVCACLVPRISVSFVQCKTVQGSNEKQRQILVQSDMSVQIFAKDKQTNLFQSERITSMEHLRHLMNTVAGLQLCVGVGNGYCMGEGFVQSGQTTLCEPCDKWLVAHGGIAAAPAFPKNRTPRPWHEGRKERRSKNRKLSQLGKQVNFCLARYAKVDGQKLEDAIRNMPAVEQEGIRACFKTALRASKCVDDDDNDDKKKGIRYTNEWIYECLLLRINSGKTYLHIQNSGILPLPTLAILQKSINALRPSYGFCDKVFAALKDKVSLLTPEERRGILVWDEMKVSEAITLDSKFGLFKGFTDLGEQQETARGDHALILMFQPFRGNWVQTVGGFVSSGCATSMVWTKLIIECIILLENTGLFVDVVTTKGAMWRMAMRNALPFARFGATSTQNSCSHPCSCEDGNDRQLWFASDFPHLLNDLRNFVVTEAEFWTPDGVVKKRHFEAASKYDEDPLNVGIKIEPNINGYITAPPEYYQNKYVGMALKLFSPAVSASMQTYKDMDPDLADSEPTVKFINRFQKVIQVMSSRTIAGALSEGSESTKVIADFIQYLEIWHDSVEEKNVKVLSDLILEGFLRTVMTTKELASFLIKECHFDFLMTSRLNEDALEAFLEMIRSACGFSDHPDSLLFIQAYRLLSYYSLVKPPKESNIDVSKILDSFLQNKPENFSVRDFCCTQWDDTLERIMERGPENCHNSSGSDARQLNEKAQAYLSGFVSKKMHKWTSCLACIESISKPFPENQRDALTEALTLGGLKYPSDALYELLSACEQAILGSVDDGEMNAYTFLHIAQSAQNEIKSFVGCPDHASSLTRNVINYYVLTRSRILSKSFNKA